MEVKTMEELAGDELCSYCQTTFGHSPETLCEGCCCEEAYERYLDTFQSDEQEDDRG